MCQKQEPSNSENPSADVAAIARRMNEEELERRARFLEHVNHIAMMQRQMREAMEPGNEWHMQMVQENEEANRRTLGQFIENLNQVEVAIPEPAQVGNDEPDQNEKEPDNDDANRNEDADKQDTD